MVYGSETGGMNQADLNDYAFKMGGWGFNHNERRGDNPYSHKTQYNEWKNWNRGWDSEEWALDQINQNI